MAKNPKPQAAGPADQGLKVTARRDSFWRAGQQFTREARVVPLSDLTSEQAEAIQAEGEPGGQLVVELVPIEAAKA